MDIPLDVGASGRSALQTNWTFINFPIAYSDITGGTFTLGLPGVTIDCRTSGQPQYSNNASTSPDSAVTDVDNNALSAPGGPGIFIGVKSAGIDQFVRLFPSDITDNNVGVWLRKVKTGEDCANPDAYRWFLCSPLYA